MKVSREGEKEVVAKVVMKMPESEPVNKAEITSKIKHAIEEE